MCHEEKQKKPATVDCLTVLDGGEAHVTDISQWSPGVDEGKPAVLSNHAYLIKHGDDWMLWDTVVHNVRGIVTRTLASQLEELGVKPKEVTHIAFSHAHFDHVGNSRYFSKARWYIQEAEYNAMFGPDYEKYGFIPDLYETMKDHQLVFTGEEYDVFGDGSVIIYSTPGHTPGHQSMLVRLPKYGSVLLGGDVAHFWSNFSYRRIPSMNTNKEQTKQSMDKVDAITRAEGAKLWLNHDYEQNKTIPHAPMWIE
jgi:N-acyl homoserine lactone hydrolase